MSESALPAIEVRDLSKQYTATAPEAYRTVRDSLAQLPSRLLSRTRQGQGHGKSATFFAVRDVTFTVSSGEVVGLIGRNGSGKTTILKILSRITRPTAGTAIVSGRVGSLLEVGTGFHQELSGRENIYLNGAILGMRRAEIEARLDEIIDFSGVERFIDTPLKHYSTGMQTRLAFAVAAHMDTEVLLVDEVLAVGDLAFQRKCLGKMEDVSRSGRTIVFVSHQMNQIRRLCQRVVWLDAGRVRLTGETNDVISQYESAVLSGDLLRGPDDANAVGDGQFLNWQIRGGDPTSVHRVSDAGPVTVAFRLALKRPLRTWRHGVALLDAEDEVIWGVAAEGQDLAAGVHDFVHSFPMLPVRPGSYRWQVSLLDEHGAAVDILTCVPALDVATENHQHPMDRWSGILNVPTDFQVLSEARPDHPE